ncbi:MAG: phosphate signaling complex protein PhoU [Rhodothermaceae bacterium]|nr:phosphate signaling complex protein PhoU [Rhodothermaceae bacterium]
MNTVIQDNIAALNQKLDEMAERVVSAIRDSLEALVEKDIDRAKQIRKEDKKINGLRWDIEEKCITLIATQQPVASDLRELIALLYIITEMERIGDYAAGVSKFTIKNGSNEYIKPLIDIPRMGKIAAEMIEQAMNAYKFKDEQEARLIHGMDDEIDQLYHQVYRELISYMIEKPENITQCTYLLRIAYNIERMGDRVTNICERILYLATGERVDDLKRQL